MKFICSIILLASLGASPGCKSLGSHDADLARAQDLGTTAGGVATAIPGATAAIAIGAPVFDYIDREVQRRVDATPEDEPLDWFTLVLAGIGAAGAGLLGMRSKRVTALTDELFDTTKALEVKVASVPKPPGT